MLTHQLAAIIKANHKETPTDTCVLVAALMVACGVEDRVPLNAQDLWLNYGPSFLTFTRGAKGNLNAIVDLQMLPETSRPAASGLAPVVSRG